MTCSDDGVRSDGPQLLPRGRGPVQLVHTDGGTRVRAEAVQTHVLPELLQHGGVAVAEDEAARATAAADADAAHPNPTSQLQNRPAGRTDPSLQSSGSGLQLSEI